MLLPALLFAALHLRTLDYGFAGVDEAEIVAGTLRVAEKIDGAWTTWTQGSSTCGQSGWG